MSCRGGPSESVLPLLPFFILIPPLSLICGVAAAMNVVTINVILYTWHVLPETITASSAASWPRCSGSRWTELELLKFLNTPFSIFGRSLDPVRVRMFYCVQTVEYIASVCLSSCQRLLDISIKYTLIIWIGYFEGGRGYKITQHATFFCSTLFVHIVKFLRGCNCFKMCDDLVFSPSSFTKHPEFDLTWQINSGFVDIWP